MSGYTPLPDWLVAMPIPTAKERKEMEMDSITLTNPTVIPNPAADATPSRWSTPAGFRALPYPPVPTGWLCPRCRTVHSPSTATCFLCRPKPRAAAGSNVSDYGLFY